MLLRVVAGEALRSRSVAAGARWVLFAPLCVSAAIGGIALAAGVVAGERIDVRWALLILLGPSLPVYLLLLPLFPFVLRALRRGWDPSPASIVGFTLLASLGVDLLFWLGRP